MSTGADGLAELLTIEEVAERLRVSVLTVRWLRQEGRFAPAIKVGRHVRISEPALAEFIKASRVPPMEASTIWRHNRQVA